MLWIASILYSVKKVKGEPKPSNIIKYHLVGYTDYQGKSAFMLWISVKLYCQNHYKLCAFYLSCAHLLFIVLTRKTRFNKQVKIFHCQEGLISYNTVEPILN